MAELRRRSAVEPIIGHLTAEHRMGRNYLWFKQRRRQQRHPRRRWLQLPPPHPMAQALLCQILVALFTKPIVTPA
jgi:IS5 family transposase